MRPIHAVVSSTRNRSTLNSRCFFKSLTSCRRHIVPVCALLGHVGKNGLRNGPINPPQVCRPSGRLSRAAGKAAPSFPMRHQRQQRGVYPSRRIAREERCDRDVTCGSPLNLREAFKDWLGGRRKAVSSTSSCVSDKTVTRCPSGRACSRSWQPFLKRTGLDTCSPRRRSR